MIFVLGRTLELSLLIFGLSLGVLGVHFGVFFRLWGQTLDPFCDFPGQASKKMYKRREKGADMEAFSLECQVFSRKCKSTFRQRRRERIEVQASTFHLFFIHVCFFLLHRFFKLFGPSLGVRPEESASEA